MKAFILVDHFGGEAREITHAVILQENVQQAAKAVSAEIIMQYNNVANVRIPRHHIPALNIPTLTFRLHVGERVDESFMFCLGIFEVPLISQ